MYIYYSNPASVYATIPSALLISATCLTIPVPYYPAKEAPPLKDTPQPHQGPVRPAGPGESHAS